jgi:hypothetical protein
MQIRARWLGVALAGLTLGVLSAFAGDQPSSGEAADKATAAAAGKAKRRCRAQCDAENGQCNSEVRQSRAECSKQAASGGNNPFLGRPEAFDYHCGYFEIAQCPDRDCAERFALRYADCVQFMRGNVTSRRFDCIRAENKAQALCRAELRDCRTLCE